MKIKIFLATDTFLYLPIYYADNYGSFNNLINHNKNDKIDVEIIGPQKGRYPPGDLNAILQMFKCHETHNTLGIAICSPTAVMSRDLDSYISKECKIIGSLIKKLPFWGINHDSTLMCTSLDQLEIEYDNVLYYNKDLKEGYYLGEKMANNIKINGRDVKWGKEIELLDSRSDAKKNKYLAISANIEKIAQVTTRETDPLSINYKFSEYYKNGYLTTGILTLKNNVSIHKEVLVQILNAIQDAIREIYKRDFAYIFTNCKSINTKFNIARFISDTELKFIVSTIKDEKFYALNMEITKKEWVSASIGINVTESWMAKYEDCNQIDRKVKNEYKKHVTNKIVKAANSVLLNELRDLTNILKTPRATISKKFQSFNKTIRVLIYITIIGISLYFIISNYLSGNLNKLSKSIIISGFVNLFTYWLTNKKNMTIG